MLSDRAASATHTIGDVLSVRADVQMGGPYANAIIAVVEYVFTR
jgi:hypothetical protein